MYPGEDKQMAGSGPFSNGFICLWKDGYQTNGHSVAHQKTRIKTKLLFGCDRAPLLREWDISDLKFQFVGK